MSPMASAAGWGAGRTALPGLACLHGRPLLLRVLPAVPPPSCCHRKAARPRCAGRLEHGHPDVAQALHRAARKCLPLSNVLCRSTWIRLLRRQCMYRAAGLRLRCRCDAPSICLCPPSSSGLDDSFLYPEDLLPFTRRPLFVVIDANSSRGFARIHGRERGYPACCLMSPPQQPPEVGVCLAAPADLLDASWMLVHRSAASRYKAAARRHSAGASLLCQGCSRGRLQPCLRLVCQRLRPVRWPGVGAYPLPRPASQAAGCRVA